MSPDEISNELLSIARHTSSAKPAIGRFDDEQMGELFSLMKGAHDVDFTNYKPSTIERRIRRRMVLHRIDHLSDYIKFLREENVELEHLYGDLLIRVTGFFRDPEVFDVLQRDILPTLLQERSHGSPIRVWVPGCATGEEAYSLAISLSESVDKRGASCPVQIFGTDISDTAIDDARAGIYPENISADVSPERLRRYFTKADGGYRVSKAIRDCCVFARQNLTKDPPFSRLDLISCRNVMIYLGSELQRKVVAIFHYALRPHGFLLLGSSETIGNFGELFSVVNRRQKIYQKKSGLARMPVEFETAAPARRREIATPAGEESPANVFREADRVLLSRFSPTGVLINDAMDILQFRGRTSPYLEPASGAASFNLLKMAREGLLSELRTAIHMARKKEVPVRLEGVRIKNNGQTRIVNVEVLPFVPSSRDRHFLVLFRTPGWRRKRRRGRRAPARRSPRNPAAGTSRSSSASWNRRASISSRSSKSRKR